MTEPESKKKSKKFSTKEKLIPGIPCPSCSLTTLMVSVVVDRTGELGNMVVCGNCKHSFRLYDTMLSTRDSGRGTEVTAVIVDEIQMMDEFANNQNDDDVDIDGNDDNPTTFDYIMDDLIPEWQVLFSSKHGDYGDGATYLGTAGQFADIYRKVTKLKRSLWDGEALNGEQPREVLLDLIGHCFLTIDMIDREF